MRFLRIFCFWNIFFLIPGLLLGNPQEEKGAGLIKPPEQIFLHPKNYLFDYLPQNEDGTINAVIEIPAGTQEKWEVKTDGIMRRDLKDGKPRSIEYLGYPVNYGMVPGTILSERAGGDGDPLDVIVIGAPLERGQVAAVKMIGVLKLIDQGLMDHKIISVLPGTVFAEIDDMEELDSDYPGISKIIEIWFENYKWPGKMEAKGYESVAEARRLLSQTMEDFVKDRGQVIFPAFIHSEEVLP